MKTAKTILLILFFSGVAFYGGMYSSGAALFFQKAMMERNSLKKKEHTAFLVEKNAPNFVLKKNFTFDGLEGIVLETPSGESLIAWFLEGRLVLGNVFSASGVDVTNAAALKHGARHPVDALISQVSPEPVDWREIKEMPCVPLDNSSPPLDLYMVSWSGCSACRTMTDYLTAEGINVNICPIGGKPTTDRAGLLTLGFKENLFDSPEAKATVRRMHKTYDIVERAFGKTAVPCFFWRDKSGEVKFATLKAKEELRNILKDIYIKKFLE